MPHEISVVMPTAGLDTVEHALELLLAGKDKPDEVIVVIDEVGCEITGTKDPEPPLKTIFGDRITVLRNPGKPDWHIVNQCYNIGFAAAKHPWIVYTHDDSYWAYNAFETLRTAVKYADRHPFRQHFPVVSVTESTLGFGHVLRIDRPIYSPHVTTCSTAVRRSFWEQFGRFDEKLGIWFDGTVHGELCRRSLVAFHLPLRPGVLHAPTTTFRKHNWAGQWEKAPLWKDCGAAFLKEYGQPFKRLPQPHEIGEITTEERQMLVEDGYTFSPISTTRVLPLGNHEE